MKKFILGLSVFVFSSIQTHANIAYRQKFIGFNTTPLLAQVVPFNRIDPTSTDVAIVARNYWGKDGLKTGFGININDNSTSTSPVQHITFMIGYDRRKQLATRVYYTKGVDFVLNIAEEIGNNTASAESFVGLGFNWGFEYMMSEVVSVSSEATLRFGADPTIGGAVFRIIPPLAIKLNFKILNN